MDIKSSVPDELKGKYDIVHVRYFLLVATLEEIPVIMENLSKLLSAFMHLYLLSPHAFHSLPPNPFLHLDFSTDPPRIIEPDGYLLWVERDFHSHQPPSPLPSTPRSTWTGWQKGLHYLRTTSPSLDWIPILESFLPPAGFEVIHAEGYPPPLWLEHAWNENVLCVWVDMAMRIQDEAERREMLDWIAQAEREVRENGYSPVWQVRVVVGRKLGT
ncbi:hypothetical protein MMC20_005118 [Loxospora ochrophaea]|nr:hypothetical protein [Loxospora ochrophaea]